VGAIKELVDELRIGQFFNFETIERLAEKRDLDSLILLTTQDFNEVNEYFQEQQRSGLSVLMIAGGWIESLFIANQVYENNLENTELKETIGEQKIVLEKILELVAHYRKTNEDFDRLYLQLEALMRIYDEVEIEVIHGDPTYEEVDGVLVAKDTSKTLIRIEDDTIKKIQSVSSKIRNEFIS
jgi:tRNA-dihydrouridine synthase